MSGDVQGVRTVGNRNAGRRQCTVTTTGKPSFRPTRTPAAANGDPTPACTCTTSKFPRRNALAIGREGSGLFAISAGIGRPNRWTGTGKDIDASRRGSGVACLLYTSPSPRDGLL